MKVAFEFPPNYEAICKAFPSVADNKRVIFTYGTTIYNPHRGTIDEALAFHEAVHSKQQEGYGGADKWWAEYLVNAAFRLQEELEAYRAQYRRYCELTKDRNKQAWLLMSIAKDLSSEQYGSCISVNEARKLIQESKSLSTRNITKAL